MYNIFFILKKHQCFTKEAYHIFLVALHREKKINLKLYNELIFYIKGKTFSHFLEKQILMWKGHTHKEKRRNLYFSYKMSTINYDSRYKKFEFELKVIPNQFILFIANRKRKNVL